MKKKALVLAALCTMALAAGCSGKKEAAATTAAPAATTAKAEEKGSEAAGDTAAAAETPAYPVDALTFICPSDAGGAMDNNTRFLAPYLEKYLGVKTDVTNMGGSACWVGWKYLIEGDKDGSLISYANFPNMITGYLDPAASIGYNKDNFEFLALYTSDVNAIMAKKDETRFTNAKEFFDYAKDNVVTIGTAGPRTDDAVAVALLEKELGYKFQHVHYQNSAEGFAAVMGGHIDALMGNVSEAVTKGDEILTLAVLSEERSEFLPDVQCTYENDIKVAASSSRGVVAAKGIDETAKAALIEALKKAMEDPEQLAEAAKQGIVVTPLYGDDFQKWIDEQDAAIGSIFDLLDES